MTAEAQAPLPATFTSAQAAQLGLSRRRLLALQEEGTIERISRGIYRAHRRRDRGLRPRRDRDQGS